MASNSGGKRRAQPSKPFYKTVTGLLATVLLLGGLSLLGYSTWAYFGTTVVAKAEQKDTTSALKQAWANDESAAPVIASEASKKDPIETEVEDAGPAFALIRIPRLGGEFEVPVVRGVSEGSLAQGVGWDQESALPGELGNFVLAGHRITHGAPFYNFPSLETGDIVEIETADATFTYELTNGGEDNVVNVTDDWVTDPVPGEAKDAKPNERIITLITCTDLYSSERRSIVAGTLIATEEK